MNGRNSNGDSFTPKRKKRDYWRHQIMDNTKAILKELLYYLGNYNINWTYKDERVGRKEDMKALIEKLEKKTDCDKCPVYPYLNCLECPEHTMNLIDNKPNKMKLGVPSDSMYDGLLPKTEKNSKGWNEHDKVRRDIPSNTQAFAPLGCRVCEYDFKDDCGEGCKEIINNEEEAESDTKQAYKLGYGDAMAKTNRDILETSRTHKLVRIEDLKTWSKGYGFYKIDKYL